MSKICLSEAFYRRKVVERGEKTPALRQIGEAMLFDWPAGYGVRPWNTVGVSIGLIGLFALLYYAGDVIRYRVPPQNASFRIRLTGIPVVAMEEKEEGRGPQGRMLHAWDAFIFSFSVYTKLGTEQRVARKWFGVVVVEWFLGLLMIAVFFYTLSKTRPDVQKLLSTVL